MENFSFIFLSLTHGFINDFEKQEKLINEVKPEIILSEQIENKKFYSKKDYDSFLEMKQFSLMTSFNEVKNLVQLCNKEKVKLIGIDFENYGFSDDLCHKINNGESLNESEEKEINELVKRREKYHLEKLREYQEKSSRPILVFLGAWHLRKEGLIRENIKNSKFIVLKTKKGQEVYEPVREEVIYEEITQ
jgi:kynurenine formamidase